VGMSVKDVVNATRGRLLSGPHDVTFTQLFVDSREVKPGGLFVALRGEQHDGHVFIPQAIERGAAGILCERPPQGVEGAAVIQVEDTGRRSSTSRPTGSPVSPTRSSLSPAVPARRRPKT